MTNKEDVENAIETYKRIIATNKNLLQKEEQLLAEINKQLEQQPKEGEWLLAEWKSYGSPCSAVIRYKGRDSENKVLYTEAYFKHTADFNSYMSENNNYRPATTSEIEYFMGLHAERLGYKAGNFKCLNDWTDNSSHKWFKDNKPKYIFQESDNTLWIRNIGYFNYLIRDSQGNWATVVTEKPKKLVKKSVNLQRKIDKLEGQLQAEKVENKRLLDLINEFVNTIKKTV